MRQGLVSQDIAAGNASFVDVFSHEALSGALHHDLRFGPYRYWHGRNCRPAPINVASFTGASPSRHKQNEGSQGTRFLQPPRASHDSGDFAAAGIPSAMIFVRNQNGEP
jgi:hypothetical protein